MSKVLKFEDYLVADKFREQVISPLAEKNPIYESIRDNDRAIAFLHYHLYIYIFLKYIPYGEETDLPTVQDSFKNITKNKRISTGEWVIDEFYRLKKEDALCIYPLIYNKNKEENWLNSLKEIIKQKSDARLNELKEKELKEKSLIQKEKIDFKLNKKNTNQ